MKPSVYIETSVISYAASKPSRDLIVAAHQQITAEWWDTVLPHYQAFISPVVLDEISRGDADAIQVRQKKSEAFAILKILPEVKKLADTYFSKLDIPEKARADTYHLALAAWHGMDYLVSWNCAHIANAKIRKTLDEINSRENIRTPVICTPEELMEAT